MSNSLRLLIVGPLPPPSGGMANQTRQLKRLLEGEGVAVEIVQTNAPYRPSWVGSLKGVRALVRLLPYVWRVLADAGRVDVVHVMANSGWAWHLAVAPAICAARLRGKPVVVNYRGGLAGEFLASSGATIRWAVSKAQALVVPSGFLQEVFALHAMQAQVVANVVDVSVFRPRGPGGSRDLAAPHVVVCRNLERIYGNDTAIRAFALLRRQLPVARLTIAGSGPEMESLRALARECGVEASVHFTGRLETPQMVLLYQSADVVLNPTRADNTPNSILEALACGVPVVSTNVGGVPYLVEHGRTAWLVEPESPVAMAQGLAHVLADSALRDTLRANGLSLAKNCSWTVVKDRWLHLYEGLVAVARRDREARQVR